MFTRLGTWCHDRRRLVVVLWVVVLFGGNAVAGAVGEDYKQDFSLPGAESSAGFDVLESSFGGQGAGIGGTIVFRAEQGVDDPEVRETMSAFFDEVSQIEGVTLVSPYSEEGAQQIAAQGPEAGKIAYAQIGLSRDITLEEAAVVSSQIRRAMPEIDGVQIEIGGQLLAEFEVPSSELLGLAFAIIVLMGFLSNIPIELEEAAFLEGCSPFRIFFRIIVPITKPAFATVAIFTFLWSYNDLFLQMIVLRQRETYPISNLLREISSQFGTDFGLMAASVVLVIVPVLIVYMFLQKNIVKGLTAGAVKG